MAKYNAGRRTIVGAVDQATADEIRRRADHAGVSRSTLVAGIVARHIDTAHQLEPPSGRRPASIAAVVPLELAEQVRAASVTAGMTRSELIASVLMAELSKPC